MTHIERIRAALSPASCGPWISAGPSHGEKFPLYVDCVVQDIDDDDCAQTICRDLEPEDCEYIAACNPAAMTAVLAHIDLQAAEISRMKTELHQHECNNFETVREQRDFLLASQALLIESAKAGQDAQDTEIANLRAQRGEPVAWMHSKTGCVSVSPYDLSLADGDETAIPLYEAPPLSEAEIQDLRDRAIGMLEKSFPEPERNHTPDSESWDGHRFKEVSRGVWLCECGKQITEIAP